MNPSVIIQLFMPGYCMLPIIKSIHYHASQNHKNIQQSLSFHQACVSLRNYQLTEYKTMVLSFIVVSDNNISLVHALYSS